MTVNQCKEKIAELTLQIDRLVNAPIKNHGKIRDMWLKNAIKARYQYQQIINEKEKENDGIQVRNSKEPTV